MNERRQFIFKKQVQGCNKYLDLVSLVIQSFKYNVQLSFKFNLEILSLQTWKYFVSLYVSYLIIFPVAFKVDFGIFNLSSLNNVY